MLGARLDPTSSSVDFNNGIYFGILGEDNGSMVICGGVSTGCGGGCGGNPVTARIV